jgi:hypothetical protein
MEATKQDEIGQMVLANMDAIEQGVRRAATPAKLGADVIADLISDAVLALLDKRGAAFDAERGSALVFCRMVGYQVATDRVRGMNRGGQFSGAYAGFGNASLDTSTADKGANMTEAMRGDKQGKSSIAPHLPANIFGGVPPKKKGITHGKMSDWRASRATYTNVVRVSGVSLDTLATTIADDIAERDWLNKARAAVVAVLPKITIEDRELWDELVAGTWDAATYAEREGIATATAHVRANRLRAKIAGLLAA